MIDYKKTGEECREAYFAYREAPIVGASEASATSFVAGWNAAIASMGQKSHEEPAEHLAGPKPDPGEGYRILSKEPLEDLTPGDEFEEWNGMWIPSLNAETNKKQGANCWYRRKIETPKNEYREPVLPGDYNKCCEFSVDGKNWNSGHLNGWRNNSKIVGSNWISTGGVYWRYCRIKAN